jgi:hypothetical protein
MNRKYTDSSIVNFWEFWYICTMFVKKAMTSSSPGGMRRKQLDYLYARRTAIDSLIRTLEEYDRFREVRAPDRKRKSA